MCARSCNGVELARVGHDSYVLTIRAYGPADYEAVVSPADRLATGRPAWRDHDRWLAAVRGWVSGSVQTAGEPGHALFVASDGDRVAGFASVSSRAHFSRDVDAYIGELVVAEWAEGRGVGRALVQTAEEWASSNGHARLTLETGAANHRALRLYAEAGYEAEDVRLTKQLRPPA